MRNNQVDPEGLRTLLVYRDHLQPVDHGRAEAAKRLFKELEALGARAGYRIEPHPDEPENVRYVKLGNKVAIVSFAHGCIFVGDGKKPLELPLVFNAAESPPCFEGSDPERQPAIRILCRAIVEFLTANELPSRRYAQSDGTNQWANSPF